MSNLMQLLKDKKKQIQAGNRKKTLKLADGTGRYRILPSWRGEGDDQFWHDFGAHYIRKPGDEKPTVYICTDKTFGKPCEVCNAIGAAIKSAVDDDTIKSLDDAKATGRILVNALHLDGSDPNEVHILELPPSVFGQIVEIAMEWVEAGETPMAVGRGKGKDFIINRTGTGKNTKYTVQIAAKARDVDVSVLKSLHNLDEYVAVESAELEQRALNAVRAAAGLMTAPSTAGGVAPSRLAAPSKATTIIEEDEYAVAEPPARRAAASAKVVDDEITDVPDSVTMRGKGDEPVSEGTGDPELDRLLSELP